MKWKANSIIEWNTTNVTCLSNLLGTELRYDVKAKRHIPYMYLRFDENGTARSFSIFVFGFPCFLFRSFHSAMHPTHIRIPTPLLSNRFNATFYLSSIFPKPIRLIYVTQQFETLHTKSQKGYIQKYTYYSSNGLIHNTLFAPILYHIFEIDFFRDSRRSREVLPDSTRIWLLAFPLFPVRL